MRLVESQHPVATARGSALPGIFHQFAETFAIGIVELSIRSLPLAVPQLCAWLSSGSARYHSGFCNLCLVELSIRSLPLAVLYSAVGGKECKVALGIRSLPLAVPQKLAVLVLSFRGRAVEQQFVVANRAIVSIKGGKGVGGFFQHLLGHGNRIAQLFKVESRYAFRRWQSDNLIVN